MSMNHGQPPTVVVGGGLAGLTTAAYLARAGRPVTLYEKSGTRTTGSERELLPGGVPNGRTGRSASRGRGRAGRRVRGG
jgi:2-polyprenyl-6-methoxyphenol hydroxylase-like FAD-dependent oxidoreductase